MIPRRLLLVLVLSSVSALAAGCGGDSTDPVSFGEGRVPASVPGDFPMPDGAVVGETLVDRVNHKTEFQYNVNEDAGAVVQYYTVSLVSAGYVVDSSGQDPLGLWLIEFSRGDLRGVITIQSGGAGLASVFVRLNTS